MEFGETVERFVRSGKNWAEVRVPEGKYKNFRSAASAIERAILLNGYRHSIHMYSTEKYHRIFLMKQGYYVNNVIKKPRYYWLINKIGVVQK